jgi:hypothetical protein
MADRFTLGWEDASDRRKGKRLGTLWADMETGEGEVTLNIIIDEDPLLRADVLQDWIGLLQREYDLAVQTMFDGIDPSHGKIVENQGEMQ